MVSRMERVNELLKQELSQILEEKAEKYGMIAVIGVDTAKDLSLAQVWIAPLTQIDHPVLLKALIADTPQYRSALLRRLNLKRIPYLEFQIDEHQDKWNRVEALLNEVSKESGTDQ